MYTYFNSLQSKVHIMISVIFEFVFESLGYFDVLPSFNPWIHRQIFYTQDEPKAKNKVYLFVGIYKHNCILQFLFLQHESEQMKPPFDIIYEYRNDYLKLWCC